jgi:hypothetical protein
MTILSNHRITSYKKARRLSPAVVKMPFKSNSSYSKKSTTVNKLIEAMLYAHLSTKAVLTPPPSPTAAPTPTAPPCTMVHRTICVWDQEYHIELPSDFDIYEGLRLWYPALHRAVMEEEELIRGTPSTPQLTEEEMEEAWARYEYLEYLSDY